MAKHKSKIIIIVVVVAVLTGAWFYGGNYNKGDNAGQLPSVNSIAEESAIQNPESVAQNSPEHPEWNTQYPPVNEPAPDTDVDTPNSGIGNSNADASNGGLDIADDLSDNEAPFESAIPDSEPPLQDSPDIESGGTQTAPASGGEQAPVEPQDAVADDGSFTVTLTVRCDTLLSNLDMLDREKHELVPADGVIFATTTVTAYEGESVFNVLQREMRRARIHMEFRNTPIYNSAYILGINNLYEFDAGELSGWIYKVNGWSPNYGPSRYQLSPGDVIEWRYSCNLGIDLGENWLAGGQRDA